jgi:hypothetical protein
MKRLINWLRKHYNNSAVGTVEAYQSILNGEDK